MDLTMYGLQGWTHEEEGLEEATIYLDFTSFLSAEMLDQLDLEFDAFQGVNDYLSGLGAEFGDPIEEWDYVPIEVYTEIEGGLHDAMMPLVKALSTDEFDREVIKAIERTM